ncbi:MAG: hypothetical protein MUO85_08610, partial [candidate division Zixibacteria bacterium]|nr:hypothetical protein [candidate division Zixibacteria bacterium]
MEKKAIEILRRIAWRRYDLIPRRFYFSREYHSYRSFLERSQYFALEQIREYQWQKIKNLLEHAYHNVPFYQERFDKLGIKPEDIKNFDDFAKLPVLKKDDVKNNLEKLKAKDFEKHKPI